MSNPMGSGMHNRFYLVSGGGGGGGGNIFRPAIFPFCSFPLINDRFLTILCSVLH